MLMLLALPITMLQIGIYALRGLADVLRGRKRLRAEATVLIDASRDVVWRTVTADHIVFDGPPTREVIREPLPEGGDLHLIRTVVDGQDVSAVVTRELSRDEAAGTIVTQSVPHPLTQPPELANDCLTGLRVDAAPQGTVLTLFDELTVQSFRDRITYPLDVLGRAVRIKRECQKKLTPRDWSARASTQVERDRQKKRPQGRPAKASNQAVVVSAVALMSFWYMFGWQDALLIAAIVVLHEGGHAAAMRMVGIEVRGIYLVPFFGGAAVPKTAYRTQGHLGFVALMGPGFSLIPTFGLAVAFWVTGEPGLLHAVSLFALINAVNLLPIYPLDGGMIVNALLGSLSRRLSQLWGWIGVLTGLGIALYLQSWLIGIPFLLFALQHYLRGGRALALKRLSFAGAAALILAFAATFALHVFAFAYAEGTAALYFSEAAAQNALAAIPQ